MGWKDWPYWLKGGVVFVLIAIMVIFLIIFLTGGWAVILLLMPFEEILPRDITISSSLSLLLISIFYLIPSFILGIVIGWIFEKIKNRNQFQIPQK